MNIALQKIIDHCGGQKRLAEILGGKTRQGHVYYWLHNNIPPKRAEAIAALFPLLTTKEELVFKELGTIDRRRRATDKRPRVR